MVVDDWSAELPELDEAPDVVSGVVVVDDDELDVELAAALEPPDVVEVVVEPVVAAVEARARKAKPPVSANPAAPSETVAARTFCRVRSRS